MSIADVIACLQRGDAAGADARLAEIIAREPRNAEALNLRAVLKQQRGDLAGALSDIDAAVAIDPKQPTAHFNRGNLLLAARRFEDAAAAFARAVELAPHDAAAWVHKAAAERQAGRDADAAESCVQALHHEPNNLAALNDGAAALGRLERFDEALALIDRLIALKSRSASAHTNRGKILVGLERWGDAVAAYRQALDCDAQHAPAWNNLGVALARVGRYAEAIEAYDRAAQSPATHFDQGHPVFNKSVSLLLLGEYARGFKAYAQRFAAGAVPRSPCADAAPEWDGAKIDGPLRIWSEQGVGDQLMFLRLLPLVFERTPNVVIDSDPRLAAMLRRAYPQLANIVAPHATHEAAAQIAMGDLARVLDIAPDMIATLPVTISASADTVARLRAKYEALAQGRPIIGIAWASPKASLARLKSAAIEHWGDLLSQPYYFVSLQYGDASSDIAAARGQFGCDIHVDDAVDQMRSIEDFAAQIAALDHIVTISNTTAHVAGAIGARCLVMLPPARGLTWYWGLEGERMPWYPNLRLVRGAPGASWSDLIGAATAQLAVDLGAKA